MLKRFLRLLPFFSVFAITCAACFILSRSTPYVFADTCLPADISNTMYVFNGWQETKNGDTYTLRISHALGAAPVSLVLCEMDSFTVIQNGVYIYSYDKLVGHQRTHIIPLQPMEEMRIEIIAPNIYQSRSTKSSAGGPLVSSIMIASSQNALRMDTFSLMANTATMGFYALILVYSISLYARKRSENYLLFLFCLALLAFLSALTNSNFVLFHAKPISNYIRYFRVIFCMALTFHLLEIHPSGTFNYILGWQGVLFMTIALSVLDMLNFGMISNIICYLMMLPTLFACSFAILRNTTGAYPLAIGVSAREGLRFFLLILMELPLNNPPLLPVLMHYYYLPQLSSLVFALGCVLFVNFRFASMFSKAEMLVKELEKANTELDTKVKKRTEQLRIANENLKMEQIRKHGMMTNIFHDLRTPIFCAQGSAEMVSVTDANSIERMNVLKDRLDFLAHMAENLFELANLEDADLQFEMFRLRAETFCRPIANAYAMLSAQKQQNFACEIENGIFFVADAYRLKSALENLLSNAVKYTHNGGSITFRVYRNGNHVHFEIEDNGPGITPEELPYIFDRYHFNRLRKKDNSAGLGLSITKAIAEKHGGAITANSEYGFGSIFILALPLDQ